MGLEPFEQFIYVEPEGPYTSWLETTSEKHDFEAWLARHLHLFEASRITGRPLSVLDIGCSWGSTSFRVIRVLKAAGLEIEYTGVDPYQPQLDKFRQLADKSGLTGVRFVQGNAEEYVPDHEHDLVIASHMLYYTSSMSRSLANLLAAGRELVVVHHGKRGINTVHEAFGPHVKAGAHVISLDDDVAKCFASLDLSGRVLHRHNFSSTVDISGCVDPDSRQGCNLISFFLERGFDSIDPEVVAALRQFLHDTYAPNMIMTHDVGIFSVTGS